jgi:hypothetical protein
MNDDVFLSDETLPGEQWSDEQLRLATSRSLASGVTLDVEAAAARESLMALGAAVESASGPFDEAAFVARLKRSCLEPATVVSTQSIRRDRWMLAVVSVLAASALIAIVRIAIVSQPANIAVVTAPSKSAPLVNQLLNVEPTARWNDSLDDEIALAAARIEQFASRQRGFDGSLLDMNERLDALSQELSGESL